MKTLVEVGYQSEISSRFIDSSSIDLFLLRAKYSEALSDNVDLFVEGEYSTFGDVVSFPYIGRNGGTLYLRDALFRLKYTNFGFNMGRFAPNFNYFLSKSILELPSIHYPIINIKFLNKRIDGIEVNYYHTIPFNSINCSVTIGKRDNYIYRLGSIKDRIGEYTKLAFYIGAADFLSSDSILKVNRQKSILGSDLKLNLGPLFLMGEVGNYKRGKFNGYRIYYSLNGGVKFPKLWFNVFYESYDTDRVLSSSIDMWIIENKFDINTQYEIDLNNKANKFYLLFKGII